MKGRLGPACPECGQRLWLFQFDAAGPGEHEPPRWVPIAVCPRCDKPPTPGRRGEPQGVMLPRTIHPVTGEPVVQPKPKGGGYGLLWIAVVALAVVLGAAAIHPLVGLAVVVLGIIWWKAGDEE